MLLPDEFPECLRASLTRPVSPRSRAAWAPALSYGRHLASAPRHARSAAVLLLLSRDPADGQWRLPLTLRPADMLHHGGQVCLPGGGCEVGETPEQSACREFAEELGAPPEPIQILGRLSPIYVFNSGFQVTPCVGWMPRRWDWTPNPAEVERVYETALEELLQHGPPSQLAVERAGIRFTAPCMELSGQQVWGATCMILGELIEHLKRIAPGDPRNSVRPN